VTPKRVMLNALERLIKKAREGQPVTDGFVEQLCRQIDQTECAPQDHDKIKKALWEVVKVLRQFHFW